MKKVSLFLITLIFCLFLVSCKDEIIESSYSVSFDSLGGTQVENIEVKGYKTPIGNLEVPTKTGYIFSGWYPSQQFLSGTKVESDSLIGKDLTLYAKWEPINLNLEFNLNGGEIKKDSEGNLTSNFNFDMTTVKYDSIISLPYMQKENYLFIGWTDELGNKIDFNYLITKDSKFVAQFLSYNDLEQNYKIEYQLNGGKICKYDLESELVDEFLTVINWYKWGDEVTIDTLMTNNRVRLVNPGWGLFSELTEWHWFLNFLQTEYQSLLVNETNEFYNKVIEVVSKTLNYEYTDNSPYQTENTIIKAEIYALFTNSKYNYQLNGVNVSTLDYSNKELKTRMWTYLEKNVNNIYIPGVITSLETPIRIGYTFDGWYLDESYNHLITEIDELTYGDVKVYAKWIED